MSSLPFAVSQRISLDASRKYAGKPQADIKVTAYVIGATVEAENAKAYLEEINCLWSVISEYILASEDENKMSPHPSSFIQYTRALEFKAIREPRKLIRER